MKYFRVPASLADKPCYSLVKPSTPNGWYLVANELLTPGECKRMNAPVERLERVTIKKTEVYNAFGARFPVQGARILPGWGATAQ